MCCEILIHTYRRIFSRDIVLTCQWALNTIMLTGKKYQLTSVMRSHKIAQKSRKRYVTITHCTIDCTSYYYIHIQIRESIKTNTNIFTLAQAIVHSTPCRPTIQLCARVALMVSGLFYIEFLYESLLYSAQYMLNVMDAKNTGISLMVVLNSSDQNQVIQP